MFKLMSALALLATGYSLPSTEIENGVNWWKFASDGLSRYDKEEHLIQVVGDKGQLVTCSLTVKDNVLLAHVCGTPGGFKPVPVDDQRVQLAAEFAVKDLNIRSNCIYHYKLVSIDKAELKVEDGNEFLLNISTCMYKPSDVSSNNPCRDINPQIMQHCVVWVLVHPWELTKMVMTSFKCTGCA